MENKSEKKPFRYMLDGRCVGALACGNSGARIAGRNSYTESTRPRALVLVDAILQRGNAVRMVNVSGQFVVTELVLA